MSAKGWYSKQDVIKDLQKVTGKCLDDFSEHYLVGENPPPARPSDEDDEDILRLYGGQKPMQSDKMEKPDLVGITQMLRMVDNYYERPNEKYIKTKETKTESRNVTFSISKLNPHANDFVPQKSISDCSTDENKVNNNELKVNKDVCDDDDGKTDKTDCCDNNVNIDDNRMDISRLLSNELQEMREQLKTKICDTAKVKCVKLRRERNLAIATLLKLYCQQPAAPSLATEENKPNLISPDYFKNTLSNKNGVTEQNDVGIDIENETDDNTVENTLNASSEADIINKEIAASVEKVTRWLHNSESDKISKQNDKVIKEIPKITDIPIKKQSKGPSIHLGPVTFRRKTNNNHSMSPVSQQSDSNSKAKSENFVPSVYATELTKKYLQQSKKQETQTDIWKSLETQLKNKDEAIKKRFQTMTSLHNM